MLLGVRVFLWPHLIASDNKCHRFLRPWRRQSLSATESPQAGRLNAWARPRSMREAKQADSGEILPAHVYHNEGKRRCEFLLGLVLFRLMSLPLQPRVVVPYLVWGAWFPSGLLLERTGRIQNFGP
jgi:hypothetical protein